MPHGTARLQSARRLFEVVLTDESGGHPLEDGQIELTVTGEVGDLQSAHGAVLLLPHERQVEDADQATVHEIDQEGQTLAGHSVARKLHDQVVDRSQLFGFVVHGVTPGVVALSVAPLHHRAGPRACRYDGTPAHRDRRGTTASFFAPVEAARANRAPDHGTRSSAENRWRAHGDRC